MNGLLTIFRRELSAYFNSAIAAIFLIVFALFTNGVFMLNFFQAGKADMRPFFNSLPFTLTIFIPAIAMRLWAEDRRGNTYELLLTFPMKPSQLVLGKYLASVVFYGFALMTTWTLPLMISWVGQLDPGVIVGGYLGMFIMGAFYLAVGIFISGLCKDQIVAFILTVVTVFTLFFLGTDGFASAIDSWLPGIGNFFKNHVGVATHLTSFAKGALDTRDILYFVAGIFIFIFLNGLSLEGRYRPKAKIIFATASAVCFVSFVLVNWLVQDLSLGRFDLTEAKANTISPVTKKVLSSLKVPVQLKLYISPSEHMPTPLKTFEREVTDKLEELRAISGGQLKYKTIHLDTGDQDDEMKEKLRNDGVAPFQVESVQKDEVGVKLIYSTLVIQYKEKAAEILPRLVPQSLGDLEYQIVSRVYKMTLEQKPKAAVFAPAKKEELSEELEKLLASGDNKAELNYEDNFKTAVLLMRNNGYDVARVNLTKDDPIPSDAKALLLLEPGSLNARQRYEINRFLFNGGTVVLAAQGYEYTYSRDDQELVAVPKKRTLDINQLIEKWGVKINDSILMDMNSQVVSLSSGQRIGPFALEMPVKFPNQIIVNEATMNKEASLTRRIPILAYLWGSALDVTKDTLDKAGLKATTLFTSTEKSWLKPFDGQNLNAKNSEPPKELKGKYPLAVLLEGNFKDEFGTPPVWVEGDKAEEAKSMGIAKPGRLLIVGCSDAFGENLIQNGGNLGFFANIIDGLLLEEDLIQVRTNAVILRNLNPVSNAAKVWYKFFSVLLVPILLLLGALIRLFIRNKEKEFYLSALKAHNE